MSDITTLEKKAIHQFEEITLAEIDQLIDHYYSLYGSADKKAQPKLIKKAGYFVRMAIDKKADSLERLDLYIGILQKVIKIHTFPQGFSKLLSQLIAKKLEIQGIEEPEILSKKTGTISLESATLCLQDIKKELQYQDFSDQELLTHTNNHDAFFIMTGGDGTYRSEIRLVSGNTPMLKKNEYKKLIGSSQTSFIIIASGKIRFSDLHDHYAEHGIKLDLENGEYLVCVFLLDLGHHNFKYIAILASAAQDQIANMTEIDQLDLLES